MDGPYPKVEIKSQLKPRGSVTEEEGPKSAHQLYSCRLNPHNQLGRLRVHGIYKRSSRAPTKDNTPVLIVVDIAGKNAQE